MKFKYKFKKSMIVLFVISYVLAVVCFVWNFIRLLQSFSSKIVLQTNGYIAIVLCLIFPILVSIFLTGIVFSSYYKIEKSALIVHFGIMKDKYLLNEIDAVIKNVKTDKLVINFKDESSLNVGIDKANFDDFSSSLIVNNKSIKYGETDE